jgi:hypothetical protein
VGVAGPEGFFGVFGGERAIAEGSEVVVVSGSHAADSLESEFQLQVFPFDPFVVVNACNFAGLDDGQNGYVLAPCVEGFADLYFLESSRETVVLILHVFLVDEVVL